MSQDPEAGDPQGQPPTGEPVDERPPSQRLRLVRGDAIVLEADGFRLIEPRGLRRSPVHAYETMTHVYTAGRMLLIGTRKGLLTIRNEDFPDPETGPAEARDALLARLAARPDGEHWMRQIERAERLGDQSGRPIVIWTTALLCVIGTAFQLRDPVVEQVGAFIPDLFGRGEYWRAVTSHFLHGLPPAPGFLSVLIGEYARMPIHLALNVGGLLVLGHLVERPLGSWRTAIILAFGGVGSIAGILFADHSEVIGASGLVCALAGAILAVELHYPSALPSYWRVPRRIFLTVIVIQFLILDQLLARWVAGGAHLGGFVGGYLAAWLLGRPSLESLVPTPLQRFSSYCAGALLMIGILGVIPLARHDMGALERHAFRLLNTPSAFYLYRHENAAAWFIATEGEASPQTLDLAIALADRAVESTGRMHPGILDTLAEALFQRGDRLGALVTIEEAIRLMPREPYFVEQRRRFTGERDPDDRPPPPGSEPPLPAAPDDAERDEIFDPDAPSVTI